MAKKSSEHSWCCCCGSQFWGWFLVIIGGYFIAVAFGWIPDKLPIWAIITLLFGIFILVKHQKK